jgi:hypothetical protein
MEGVLIRGETAGKKEDEGAGERRLQAAALSRAERPNHDHQEAH